MLSNSPKNTTHFTESTSSEESSRKLTFPAQLPNLPTNLLESQVFLELTRENKNLSQYTYNRLTSQYHCTSLLTILQEEYSSKPSKPMSSFLSQSLSEPVPFIIPTISLFEFICAYASHITEETLNNYKEDSFYFIHIEQTAKFYKAPYVIVGDYLDSLVREDLERLERQLQNNSTNFYSVKLCQEVFQEEYIIVKDMITFLHELKRIIEDARVVYSRTGITTSDNSKPQPIFRGIQKDKK